VVSSQVWKSIEDVPEDADLCVLINDAFGSYQIPFPCQFRQGCWLNARTGTALGAEPIGWVHWKHRQGKIWRSF
jgi:hypothetical protein